MECDGMGRVGIIAIDPGLGGAVAMLVDGKFADAFAMPTARTRTGRNQVDARELGALFQDLATRADTIRCLVELVTARPGQGVSSMFSLGDSFGTARAIASMYTHQVAYVTPAVWKRAAGLTKDKLYSLTRARECYPAARERLKRKKDEGLAEALLLAKYGHSEFKW